MSVLADLGVTGILLFGACDKCKEEPANETATVTFEFAGS